MRANIEERQQPLEVERLIPADLRRVTVEDHAAFRKAMEHKPEEADDL